ncbi:MAG TPA: ferritin family protein [Halanaerobiales bacterium]|nr:ferritin family protein [Halanaerobiales bacterium]
MKEVLEGILEAIEDEIQAQNKYKTLKEQAENDKAKALFDQLIQDEKGHEKLLRSRYEALKSQMENTDNG